MPTQIEKLLDAYQGNAYPAMLEDLGRSLGVTADSLRRLALGWAPIVTFKKGPNFAGWWVIPERDADGVPVGLSLRSQFDMKVMYPGSKHGLIYEVNPQHERGGEGYSAGASNWIRTMDAGQPCPICEKPDGCLLSAENPADPKAVICIRVKEDALKPMRFGYLHIRKAEGHMGGNSALADNGGPVLIVEGMSDAAAALDLGFDAVGRPSNLACMDMLCDLVRGREVIVVGENDKKPDGREPGREGMIAAFQMVRRVCKVVTNLMPPEHVKDLRAWVAKYKLTRQVFLEYHATEGKSYSEELTLADAKPLTIARAYLRSLYEMGQGRYTLRRWQNVWWKYNGAKYVEVDPESFRQPFYGWSDNKSVNCGDKNSPLVCNTSLIANVEDAVMSQTLVPQGSIPCWINNRKGPDPRDLIVFNNGILHVPNFLAGKSESDYLLEPTPDLFTTVALPFSFDPTAQCPLWKGFLRTSLGDDTDKIKLLREWLGYCLTSDTSLHKLLYLRGPTGAGKSVILNILCKMVGEDQVASTSFRDLCGDFGVQALIGKQVCVIPDVRVSAKTDVMRGLELLLNITAGDGIQINRKFKDPVARYKLMTRITIAGNDFVDVPDHAGAMVRRLNVIEFTQSFVGREDFALEEKLTPEIPGIATWALAGLRRLRETGSFTFPESSRVALTEWRRQTSPLASFIDECTLADPNAEVLKDELWDCWCGWIAERRNISQISKAKFYERLRMNAPHAISDCYDKGGHKYSVFRGLSLERLAARKFLGKP